jgi:DNA-binding MarR family transcriptional regulator
MAPDPAGPSVDDVGSDGSGPEEASAEEVSAAELTERVMRVAHHIRRAAMATLPVDLTPAQSRALRIIARAAEPMRMGELAATLGVVPRSATGLVDALEATGMVVRTVDPSNRRSVLVSLTGRGLAVQEEMSKARAQAGAGMFDVLTGAERRQLAELLGRIAQGPR